LSQLKLPFEIEGYRIVRRLGLGGMATVYLGIQRSLGRPVAIKVLATDHTHSEDLVRRFEHEARTIARLDHPHIVSIFDVGRTSNGQIYYTMPYLPNGDLAGRNLRENQPAILDVIRAIADALGYAHEQGIVHRDVKPANIWLLEDGTVKLLDFGIAKIAASTMTSAGSVLGSAFYMAPEQVTGREVDGRADIFAAGVVLYELLANHRPFEGESPTVVMMKIVNEDATPITKYVSDLPPALAAAVMKALHKEPARRFPHAGDFGAELRLLRLTAERGSETVLAEREDLAQTMFIPSAADAAVKPPTAPPAATDPAAQAMMTPAGPVTGAQTVVFKASKVPTWLAIAGLGLAAVAVAIALTGRSGSNNAAPAATVATTGPTAVPPAAPATPGTAAADRVKVVSDPEGARVVVGGKDSGVTPADIALNDVRDGKVRVSKRGFRSMEVRASLVQNGVAFVKLDAEPMGIGVDLSGTYPFEVWDGGRKISAASTHHEISLESSRTIRLRSSEVLLDLPVKIEGQPGSKASAQAPALGKLTLRTPLETCKIVIGGRDFGYPPLNEQPMAAGSHDVELKCPDGTSKQASVSITPGQTHTEVIR